jgi:hypothetical protein
MFTNPISKIFVVLLVVGVALLTVSFASRSPAAAAADRSYDAVEQLRGQAPVALDTSYDAIEDMRVQQHVEANSPASDYDLVEALRINSSFFPPANPYLDYRRGEWSGQ